MYYFTIYKITNLINNKIYIGKHKTKNPYDSYLGSGKAIKSAIEKYGKENFKKEILFIFDTEDEMDKKEQEIVNEDFIKNPDVYNIAPGGEGGHTTKHFDEKKKKEYTAKRSESISLMWSKLTPEERSKRNKKKRQNVDPTEISRRMSVGRKRFFANETPEEREIRRQKAKEGNKKVKKLECRYCKNLFRPGNLIKHENTCKMNPIVEKKPEPNKRKIFEYILIDPNGVTHITKSLRGFCDANKLSKYLLQSRIGKPVIDFGLAASNCNEISNNTLGWCLLEVHEI